MCSRCSILEGNSLYSKSSSNLVITLKKEWTNPLQISKLVATQTSLPTSDKLKPKEIFRPGLSSTRLALLRNCREKPLRKIERPPSLSFSKESTGTNDSRNTHNSRLSEVPETAFICKIRAESPKATSTKKCRPKSRAAEGPTQPTPVSDNLKPQRMILLPLCFPLLAALSKLAISMCTTMCIIWMRGRRESKTLIKFTRCCRTGKWAILMILIISRMILLQICTNVVAA